MIQLMVVIKIPFLIYSTPINPEIIKHSIEK
jgi:hypothetical protein